MRYPPRRPIELPAPSVEESASSQRLCGLIRDEIVQAGALPFSRFMDLALYAPGLGYYAAGKQKFGEAGDFITAPESYPLFGKCLAAAAVDVLAEVEHGRIVEVGAGSGRLAATLLNELGARGTRLDRYEILELSAELRHRQMRTISEQAPRYVEHVRWLDDLPPPGFRGLVLANEVLDAMPVERFRIDADGVRRLCIIWHEDRFAWTDTAGGIAIEERVLPLDLPSGYVSEIGFAAEAWVRSIGERLAAGAMLLVDYGYPRAEFYHRDRRDGTLMCHYRHRAHADPLILAGLQDITAHVDFTAIAEAGVHAGLEVLGYTSQAAFLIGSGIEQFAQRSDASDVRAHLALTDQIKKLTSPHEMGELYKVMVLGKGIEGEFKAFALQDRRNRL